MYVQLSVRKTTTYYFAPWPCIVFQFVCALLVFTFGERGRTLIRLQSGERDKDKKICHKIHQFTISTCHLKQQNQLARVIKQ